MNPAVNRGHDGSGSTDITDEQIERLMDEARRYSDDFMIAICARALSGSRGHRECCALTLRDVRVEAEGARHD